MPLAQKNVHGYAGLRDKIWTRCFKPTASDEQILREVNECCCQLESATNADLAKLINDVRQKVQDGFSSVTDLIAVPVLAVIKQAIRRTSGMSVYDVQVLAGIAMSRGAIAEMQTGEGKTLASAFPIALHALTGRGVHVATVNAYLAERDFQLLRAAFELVNFSVGLSRDGAPKDAKRAAYECDITFATGYELGFDFLRDQIALMSRGQQRLGAQLRRELFCAADSKPIETQRSHAMAIIDEIDSVLIDEAITPLVLSSGGMAKPVDVSVYHTAKQVAELLKIETDFVIDRKTKSLYITENGSEKAHQLYDQFVAGNPAPDRPATPARFHLFSDRNKPHQHDKHLNNRMELMRPWRQYVESALRAKHIMVRDINYVVFDDKVEIVDEFTGRIFSDRNWRDGLHQAVEAQENATITEEKHTLARISRQRYFQRYDILCGMTGTASGHQRELLSCYELPVVVIPLRTKSLRRELPTLYYDNETNKVAAIVADAIQRHQSGQPVLIGTRTIEQSLRVSQKLSEAGANNLVLNGIQDADEAAVIAVSGRSGSITVATNMAGRGTDIKPEPSALAVGGLHVIGYERNLSTRIDRQLLGRAGRQGDPGSGQFFVSGEDDIVTRFDSAFANTLANLPTHRHAKPNRGFDRRIMQIQTVAESESYRSRCQIMQEEMWLNQVKKVVG